MTVIVSRLWGCPGNKPLGGRRGQPGWRQQSRTSSRSPQRQPSLMARKALRLDKTARKQAFLMIDSPSHDTCEILYSIEQYALGYLQGTSAGDLVRH